MVDGDLYKRGVNVVLLLFIKMMKALRITKEGA